MIKIDLYKKYYLGELETTLIEKNSSNQILFEVILYDYHFNKILSLIPLGQYDSDSVMYNYFNKSGWYDKNWECERVQEFLDQLNTISNLVSNDFLESFNAVKKICESVISHNNRLYIELL